MDIFITSSLEKIFENDDHRPEILSELYLLKGEKCFFQIVVFSEKDSSAAITIRGAENCCLYEVKSVYSSLAIYDNARNCTVLNDGKSGMYPDLLCPVNGNIVLRSGRHTVFFAEINALPCEQNNITVSVEAGNNNASAAIDIYVSKTEIEKQKLIHTNWFHADCLAVYYNVPVFSEEHWRIIDNFISNAAEYGINCILTPLFTPPLDTEIGGERPTIQLVDVKTDGENYVYGFSKLKRYIDTAFSNGIEYIEFSHLFTQWGAKHAPKIIAETPQGEKRIFGWETDAAGKDYEYFLSQFGKALREFTDREGITHKCFIHCSDEPHKDDYAQYKKASGIIKKYFGAYRHIDALSDVEFYKDGLVDIPVPEENKIGSFANLTDDFWAYYCCGQYNDELPNRFFAMPSVKNRILGALLYKFNCRGFLQWGYNFYFSQYSKRSIDPFIETDAGGAFPSGDAFIVYPGENGEPLPSLRQFVFYEGLCDLRALQTVESLTSKETALKLINDTLGDIDFHNYPMNNKALLSFRKVLYNLTERN